MHIYIVFQTLFGIGSCSKAFAATALGILIDDFAAKRNVVPLPSGVSSLTWRTKVKDLLPTEWRLQDKIAESEANLQDIVSHVTGLPGQALYWLKIPYILTLGTPLAMT